MIRFAAFVVFAAALVSAACATFLRRNVDCVMSDWTPQACDVTTNRQVFTRTIVRPQRGFGRPCGPLRETRLCRSATCAQSGWAQWSLCLADDYRVRTRFIELLYNGQKCPVERVRCNRNDCLVSEWSPWVCEGGTKTRRRQVVRPRRANGLACPELVESAPCDPIDCVLESTWVTATTCDATTGLMLQTRGEAIPAQHGGEPCQVIDKQRAFRGVCSNGLYCALVSPGQYGCKPPATVNGSIFQTADAVSIDYVDFAITAPSLVELDVLSMEATASDTGTTYMDVNGDCSAHYIDSSIVLLSVNADGSNNQVISSNDNATMNQGLSDGSLSPADSYLSASLQPGRYRVVVGVSSMTTADALAKTMVLTTDSPRKCDSRNAQYGNYQLSISARDSDVTVTSPNSYVGSQCSSLRTSTPLPLCPYHTSLATNIVEGTIKRNSNGVSVDYIKFTMSQTGTVAIDVTSHESSPSGFVSVNGYCGSAYMDSYIYVFRATPGADTVAAADFIASSDDGGLQLNARSVHSFDSYLSIALESGDYVLVIGAYYLSMDDAVARISNGGFAMYSCGQSADAANYQVNFTAPFDISPVSPGSFAGKYCPEMLGQHICV